MSPQMLIFPKSSPNKYHLLAEGANFQKNIGRKTDSMNGDLSLSGLGYSSPNPTDTGCGKEGLASSAYYKWSEAFPEAGRNGVTRAVIGDATIDNGIMQYNEQLHRL